MIVIEQLFSYLMIPDPRTLRKGIRAAIALISPYVGVPAPDGREPHNPPSFTGEPVRADLPEAPTFLP